MESSVLMGETRPPETLMVLQSVDKIDEKRAYRGCSRVCFSVQS